MFFLVKTGEEDKNPSFILKIPKWFQDVKFQAMRQ